MNIYDADSVLNLSLPGDLFSGDIAKMNHEYKAFVKIWHPDNNLSSKAEHVMGKITDLYHCGTEMLLKGIWEKSGFIRFTDIHGILLNIHYFSRHRFEIGEFFICDKYVVYVFDQGKEGYCKNALENIKGLTFFDKQMKKEFERYLPVMNSKYDLTDGRKCIVLEKPTEALNLFDAFTACKKEFYDKHVAWIISRLINFACYLDFNRMAHNGVNMENCFILPKAHGILFSGGWWYSAKQGTKMTGISKEIFDIMPIQAKESKCASIMTDLESIKLLGRKLTNGLLLPNAFQAWLSAGAQNTAFKEMERWDETIIKSYGKRQFVKMDVDKNKVYQKEDALWDAEAGLVKIGKTIQKDEGYTARKR